ncbi:BadF/BadG/BcrA/BcrD ATPase family protein [Fervidobacterium gondwanense]|uniref:BadF-type ATPase n=1 Tax=Fervidobacterium gondwanense DSM 13020 TaxID=1121883 RepID=A0A1M7T3D0_FERGO|nr:BadF/BadG/BcrA/BcrD ATPase family protein [Fervidobacterium gondwanense]SHN65187.1 BadF-type ATPase [Fervidobacterium gondwanense DSM 13020]
MIALGIDGGGTSTKVCLAIPDRKVVILEFSIPCGINLTSTPSDIQLEILNKIRDEINRRTSGLEFFDSVIISISGGGSSSRRLNFKNLVSTVFRAGKIIVLSDIEVLKEIVLKGRTGILVICGTGSIAISHTGKRVGGWGHLFGDEASAFSISLEIFRRFFEYIDGVEEYDKIFDVLLNFYKVTSVFDLTTIQLESDFKRKIASFTEHAPLTPLVRKIIDEQLTKLTQKISYLASTENVSDIYYFGGTFKNEYFTQVFCKKLHRFNLHYSDIKPHVELALDAPHFLEASKNNT